MFVLDIDVVPPDVDVLEVVVVDSVGAGVEVTVFDAVEIVVFGGGIFFVSNIFVIGFIAVDSEGADVVSTPVGVLEVVGIDSVKVVVGVDLLDPLATFVIGNIEVILSNIFGFELKSVSTEGVFIFSEVVFVLGIIIFENIFDGIFAGSAVVWLADITSVVV